MSHYIRPASCLPRARWLMGTVSAATIALVTGFAPAPSKAENFGTMVGMQAGRIIGPNGQVSQWSGANAPQIGSTGDGRPLMTIEQTKKKALLDWEDFRLKSNEVLEFQQKAADWIAVNRVHGEAAAEVNGEIRARGRVFIFNDNGVLIGDEAKINTRQLVTGRGFSDVTVDGSVTTLVQSSEKASLNWTDLSTQAGEVLKFQQAKKNWIALNRSVTNDVTKMSGDIEADGHVMLVAPNGLSIDGDISAQQVVASSLDIRDSQFFSSQGLISWAEDRSRGRMDPTFSNTWLYVGDGPQGPDVYFNLLKAMPEATDPDDPLRYGVTVGRDATVSTREQGKVMLFGPNVTNKGTIKVRDEGQVILAAGDNIYLEAETPDKLSVYTGAYNPLNFRRVNIRAANRPQWTYDGVVTEEWVDFIEEISGTRYEVGYVMTPEERNPLFQDDEIDGEFVYGGRIGHYLKNLQQRRVEEVGFHARNEGIIEALRGGHVDFRGHNLEQMGAVTITSTAAFRGSISLTPVVRDHKEFAVRGTHAEFYPGQGNVYFGVGSLTQITPDLDSTDTIPVSEGPQSVGSLTINAGRVHMQEDALIYMPSGDMKVVLDAGEHVLSNRGPGANTDNEDGTRFLMDSGATIDLSGWETTLDMGYHQVTGRLFAAQLRDAPLQRDGALYRKEISVDRRYGTKIADWESFDNLNQGALAQFLINGGKLDIDVGDDFIMKSDSVIDVSGGKITYEEGHVYTTLLRRLDGTVIDIRAADPDELYMGLANEWVQYDTKWGKQQTYYIPLMSSLQGRFETSYEHGGDGGEINILAPDAVFQGTLKGETTAGRYQRVDLPTGGSFTLGDGGETELEYVTNVVLISDTEQLLAREFGLHDQLSNVYGNFFGEEFEHGVDEPASKGRLGDNATLMSEDFFNRSTMGSYLVRQFGRPDHMDRGVEVLDGFSLGVEEGVDLTLSGGASLALEASGAMQFLGSIRTEGGDIELSAEGMVLGENTRLDTRGSWYSDYELDEPVALSAVPRIHGGDITLISNNLGFDELADTLRFTIPETAVLDSSGGAWVDRSGTLSAGRGGDISVESLMSNSDDVDLSGLQHARAFGIGGNGAFEFSTRGAIHLGEGRIERGEDYFIAEVFDPTFFQNSGFSAITLEAGGGVVLEDGVQVEATSATMRLRPGDLQNGVPGAWTAPSGTDIYDLTETGYLPAESRPENLRDGMDITLDGTVQIGPDRFNVAVTIGEGSLLATEAGGALGISGPADIHGTLFAPAGTISLTSGSEGVVTLHETAQLRAPGAVRVLERTQDSLGRALTGGEVLPGGTISLATDSLVIRDGAVLDVSGTSAAFDLAQQGETGTVVRQPREVASDGGTIGIYGKALDIDGAVYNAAAGGDGARGGSFVFEWESGGYGLPDGSRAPSAVISRLQSTYYYLKEGGYVQGLFDVDLSTVDLAQANIDIEFEPGTYLDSPEEMEALLSSLNAAAVGQPPVLMIGNDLDLEAGGAQITPPEIDPKIQRLVEHNGYIVPEASEVAAVTALSPDNLASGGFSEVSINSRLGIVFSGELTIGGRTADGGFTFHRVHINAPEIFGAEGAHARIAGDVVTLSNLGLRGSPVTVDEALYDAALGELGVDDANVDTSLTVESGKLLQIDSAEMVGFLDTLLTSQGDIRLVGGYRETLDGPRTGFINTAGNLTFKADQLYAASAREYTVTAGKTLTVLPQDADTPLNASPYEAGATLTLTAPRIVQGGIVRSPLGSINLVAFDDGSEDANSIQLLPGSLTSVSAEGKGIPYGITSNGDTWIDPVTGKEMVNLPERVVNLSGDVLDLQEGAVIDVEGGGDLLAYEFVPGVGGSTDWLTGYRDKDYEWVDDGSGVYAVLPDFDADIAPVGIDGANLEDIGRKVYLSGGSGLPAGHYTLLPARYAQLPGAFRVTENHHHSGYEGMVLGDQAALADGSSIQAGYRVLPGSDAGRPDQVTDPTNYLVMPGEALEMRSSYIQSSANEFFVSEAYLGKALRTNLPVGDLPRVPTDGGGVVLAAGRELSLDATLISAAAEGGRGGYADIVGRRMAVVGTDTDLSLYEDYLVLDSDRLNAFGAESLLLGGLRHQGETDVEVEVAGREIVIDNGGSVLFGPELLFAAADDITVKTGSTVEARGDLGGASGDLILRPYAPTAMNNDTVVHDGLDWGSLLRVSTGEQIDVVRDSDAVDAWTRLSADPARLAQINEQRVAIGLAPLTPGGGRLTMEGGAEISSPGSILFDATINSALSADAAIDARQISAASSRVSIGETPLDVSGLVFAGSSAGALASAQDLVLKSYSSIDFYGPVSLSAEGGITLDSRQIRALGAGGGDAAADTVTISGTTVTLANSNGGTANATTGAASLRVEAETIYLTGGDKWLSGAGDVTLDAPNRVIGRDSGTVFVPGGLNIQTGELTAESGARLVFDAADAVHLTQGDYGVPEDFDTLGATLGIRGATVTHSGRIGLTGGTVNLRARTGDLRLAEGSVTDVTSNTIEIFDVAVGVGAGQVALVSDRQDVRIDSGALVDVSGTEAGGDAGSLVMEAGLGEVVLDGTFKGDAGEGQRSGSISLLTRSLADFAALNARIDEGGFRQGRRFEANEGDVLVSGTVEAQELAVVANDGGIDVTGTLATPGADGGRIQLSAAQGIALSAGSQLLARAQADDGSGGTVLLETAGAEGGVIDMASGAVIDVSGTGKGGRVVRFRAPQVGSDVAIGSLDGDITGARAVIAEAFRTYDDIAVIDQDLIDTVSADAIAFMANAGAIQARLGGQASLAPGIELRSDGDMELVTDWDLHDLRFGADRSAGVLTLRARGDLLINANLSDGFDSAAPEAALLDGESWMLSLAAGANTTSPDSFAVLPAGQLADGKGSIVVGGTPDTLEYFRTPADFEEPPLPDWLLIEYLNGEITASEIRDWVQEAYGNGELPLEEALAIFDWANDGAEAPIKPHYGVENKLFLIDENGRFLRDESETNYHVGFLELDRDPATGKYIDPRTGDLIDQDPETGDYVDTEYYARRPLPWIVHTEGGQRPENQEGEVVGTPRFSSGDTWEDYKPLQQWNNATGYVVRTGSGAINLAAGRDLVLQERPSVIYTAGQAADAVDNFHAPAGAAYSENGGDIAITVAGDIVASPDTPQMPLGWQAREGALDRNTGYYRPDTDRLFSQTTWYADFENYQAGIGALGGGNVDITVGGDVHNLSVSIPTTGRMAGNTGPDEPFVLHTTGGGDFSLRAGGDIYGGVYYIQDGRAEITAGGSILAGSTVETLETDWTRNISIPECASWTDCYIHAEMAGAMPVFDIHTMVFTSTGDVRITSGGDLNLEAVMDPMLQPLDALELVRSWEAFTQFQSFTSETQVSLFSAGGDVRVWNNGINLDLVRQQSRTTRFDYWTDGGNWINEGESVFGYELWPATISMTAASGNVEVLGGMMMAPAARGNLDLLAGRDVRIGYYTRMEDATPRNASDKLWTERAWANNYRSARRGIYMSQAKPEFLRTTVNMTNDVWAGNIIDASYKAAGADGSHNGNARPFDEEILPDLHAGDPHPARIYAATGDVITTAPLDLPKALWVQAEGQVYFPDYRLQHNHPNDLSLIRAEEGIYFSETGEVAVAGPGRLEIEAGSDVWIPSNAKGITTRRITFTDQNPNDELPPVVWRPDEKAADIAISVGYNETPEYAAFEQAYFDPSFVAEMEEYLLAEGENGESVPAYLFDRFYARGSGSKIEFASPELIAGFVNYIRGLQGLDPLETDAAQGAYLDQAWDYWLDLPASQETAFDGLVPRMTRQEAEDTGAQPHFYLPEHREGLVNYVRRLQGLEPLQSQEEQQAYLDQAWEYWSGLDTDSKSPFYRNVLFLELRTTGREANDPDSDRNNSSVRGYDAIATLFPGAEKRADETLAEGESRWDGQFETFASRVISSGGGKIEVVAPGGAVRLASIAASEEQTGQPTDSNPRGDALRAGVVTRDGGEINMVSRDSVTINQSRILTTKGGNVMIWTSYGDIAAGNGAKTSVSPAFYDYATSNIAHLTRSPAGLPTGAGIGTLASAPGAPAADVDLIAPDGIVDAGDAGIWVSGNFDVFAVQILGTDNIDVGGVSKGLPVPPAALPTSMDTGEVSAQANAGENAADEAADAAQRNSAVVPPSIIEVRVTGYGECEDDSCSSDDASPAPQAEAENGAGRPIQLAQAIPSPEVEFDIVPQELDDAVRSVAQQAGVNVLYDTEVLQKHMAPALNGSMTAEEALGQLLSEQGLEPVRLDQETIMVRKRNG